MSFEARERVEIENTTVAYAGRRGGVARPESDGGAWVTLDGEDKTEVHP